MGVKAGGKEREGGREQRHSRGIKPYQRRPV